MPKLVALTFFLIFCLAAAVLQNVFDFVVLQNRVAAQQTNTNSATPRKPNDSVPDVWRTTISESKIFLTAAVTTNGEIPNGEAQTMLQLQCRADSNDVASINYIVLDAFEIKSFNFSDFEGPNAPVKLKKLVEFRATSPSGSLTFRDSVAGYYRNAGETTGFYFTTYPNTQRDNVARLVRMIAKGSTKVTVIVHGYRNNRKTIETTFPAMDAASDAVKTFSGCLSESRAARIARD